MSKNPTDRSKAATPRHPNRAVRQRQLLPLEVIDFFDGALPTDMSLQSAIEILSAAMPDVSTLLLQSLVDVKRANQIATQHLAWACIQSHLPAEHS